MLNRWILIIGGLIMAVGVAASYVLQTPGSQGDGSQSVEILYADSAQTDEFARAFTPLDLSLPRDHGPHFDFQTEWWYFTGNLETLEGRPYGYQLTLFRRGLTPGFSEIGPLANNQVYFGHFALTDIEGDIHFEDEKWSRGSDALAGAMNDPFEVRLENWIISGFNGQVDSVELQAVSDDFAIDLQLVPQNDLVLHGESGLSLKSLEPGNASYYLSHPNMHTTGTIEIAGDTFEISGNSWFDHEWSTSALGAGSVGWDWFGLQLDDGRELMLFQIRQEDGRIGPVSGGTLVETDGTVVPLSREDVWFEILSSWTSSASGIEYPSSWNLRIPSASLDLTIRPRISDQEMNMAFVYWEGAVEVDGSSRGEPVRGFGYMELTGYGGSMQGVF